jgi:hypothetical protein
MAETPSERRKAYVSSTAKAHNVLANDNQIPSFILNRQRQVKGM